MTHKNDMEVSVGRECKKGAAAFCKLSTPQASPKEVQTRVLTPQGLCHNGGPPPWSQSQCVE